MESPNQHITSSYALDAAGAGLDDRRHVIAVSELHRVYQLQASRSDATKS
jgi:hypothetical protein